MNKRNFVRLASMTLAAGVAVAPFVAGMPAQAQTKCDGTGVYLVTTDNGNGPQFTFNVSPDGSVTAMFSNSGIVNSPTAAASTPDQGVYSCRNNRFKFRMLEFNLAAETGGRPASINRIEGNFTYDPGQKTISGRYELREFPLNSNPFGEGGRVAVRRTFTGVQIPVR